MPSFPSIGKLLTANYNEKPTSVVLRTDMESGPAKQARRYSQTAVQRQIRYAFTAAEYATFQTFFYTTIQYGALKFSWVDPVDNTTKDARIVKGEYTAQAISPSLSHYYVSFVLETWV